MLAYSGPLWARFLHRYPPLLGHVFPAEQTIIFRAGLQAAMRPTDLAWVDLMFGLDIVEMGFSFGRLDSLLV